MRILAANDNPGYWLTLAPLIEEFQRRTEVCDVLQRSERRIFRTDYDMVLFNQTGFLFQDFGRKIFVYHGVSVLKSAAFAFDTEGLVAPGPYWTSWMRESAKVPVFGDMGWPKMDAWFRMDHERRLLGRSPREIYGFDARPIVAFSPTWKHDHSVPHTPRNYRLSQILTVMADHFNVLVAPHPYETEDISGFADMPGIRILGQNETDARIEALLDADVIVGDVSGVMFESLYTDKPIVVIDAPEDQGYFVTKHPTDPQLIDCFTVADGDRLADAIWAALNDPLKPSRGFWKEQILGPTDGHASRRIADALIGHYMPKNEWSLDILRSCSIRPDFMKAGRVVDKSVFKPKSLVLEFEQNGIVLFGPYVSLEPGNYTFGLSSKLATGAGTVLVEVFAGGAYQKNLFVIEAGTNEYQAKFSLSQPLRNVEIRLMARNTEGKVQLRLSDLTLSKSYL